jgi:hypothetical protein
MFLIKHEVLLMDLKNSLRLPVLVIFKRPI